MATVPGIRFMGPTMDRHVGPAYNTAQERASLTGPKPRGPDATPIQCHAILFYTDLICLWSLLSALGIRIL